MITPSFEDVAGLVAAALQIIAVNVRAAKASARSISSVAFGELQVP